MSDNSTVDTLTTCPVCMERYTNPKLLPCHHSFCLDCINRWVDSKKILECPMCRCKFEAPTGGFKNLPNSFTINTLIDGMSAETKINFCKVHTEIRRDLYCQSCKLIVCVECFDSDHKPRGHDWSSINKSAEEFRKRWKDTISVKLKASSLTVQTRLYELEKKRKQLKDHKKNIDSLLSDALSANKSAYVGLDSSNELISRADVLIKITNEFDFISSGKVSARIVHEGNFTGSIEDVGSRTQSSPPGNGRTQKITGGLICIAFFIAITAFLAVRYGTPDTVKPVPIPQSKPTLSKAKIEEKPSKIVPSSVNTGKKPIEHLKRLKIGGNVIGMAQLRHRIYVAQYRSTYLIVYDATTFQKVGIVLLSGIEYLYSADMTLSDDGEFLFVTDWKNERIWRITENTSEAYRGITNDLLFKRLWVSSDEHLMSLFDNYPPWLNVYDHECQLIRSVTLSADMQGLNHAVDATPGTYIISHGNAYSKNRVCEVTTYGSVIRCYGAEKGASDGLLDSPRDIAIDYAGYIYVCDYNNNRVVMLDSKFNLIRVILIELNDSYGPEHLFYDRNSGRLLIGMKSGHVDVYNVHS